eukprot:NODE_424_length_7676_cov_0.895209.p5 type:complete len:197 gc:universal NODE_424_length_7676_cov_0.895209:2552-1962(-)
MKSRTSSATSYYTCCSHLDHLPHVDSKFNDKKGFQSEYSLSNQESSRVIFLDSEYESLIKVVNVLEQEIDSFKSRERLLNNELSIKSTLIQKLLLENQLLKGSKDTSVDVENFYKSELHAKTCELELTKKMLGEFHKLFKGMETRLVNSERDAKIFKEAHEKQEKILSKFQRCSDYKDEQIKHLRSKLKQMKLYKK